MKKCFIQSIPFGVGGLLVFVVTALAQNSSDPCTTNTLLSERAHNTSYEGSVSCGGGTVQGQWYRFEADGPGEIATNCPAGNQCGSGTRIWINGSQPGSSDGVVSRIACMAGTSSCCSRAVEVSVKYCSGYFVYNVGFIPACASVCLNNTAISTSTSTTSTPTTSTTTSTTTPTTPTPTSTSTTTSTTTATTTAVPSISTTLETDPCLAYNNLTDGFAMIDETDQHNESIIFFPPGWYRLPYTLTGTLSTSCPQGNQCGSGDIIWSNGRIDSNTEAIITIQLCLKTSRACCERTVSSRQKICQGFLIYDLPPPIPRTRLCYNNTVISTSTSTISTPTTSTTTSTTTPTPTSTTSTTTTTPTTTSTTTSTTTTTSPSISTTLERDPCLAYNNLTDGFTMVDETHEQNESITFFPPGWYRMPYTLTGTLSTSCPQGNQCGSGDIIWSNGHIDSNTEAIITIQLCLKTSRGCCERTRSSRQKICQGFLIYDLPPAMPRTRLCYNNTESSTSTSSISTPIPTTISTTTSPTTPITTTTSATTSTTSTTTASSSSSESSTWSSSSFSTTTISQTSLTSSTSPKTTEARTTASITTTESPHDDPSASTLSTNIIIAIAASGVIVVCFIIAILIVQCMRKSDSAPVTKERAVFDGADNNTYGMRMTPRGLNKA